MSFDAKRIISETAFKSLLAETVAAGDVLKNAKRRSIEVTAKEDGSSRTNYDVSTEERLKGALATLTPHIPVLSEEASVEENTAALNTAGYLWVMDPLDGTRSFINGHGEYTINIALLSPPSEKPPHNRTPLLGINYSPTNHELLFTDLDGYAKRGYVHTTPKQREKSGLFRSSPCVVSASANLSLDRKTMYVATSYYPDGLDIFGDKYPIKDFCYTGAYRTAKVMGDIIGASLFQRDAAIWDVAAVDAIMRAAGGRVFPIEPTHKMITGDSIYYGADTAHYRNNKLFNAGPYIGINPKLALELGMKTAPGVQLPITEVGRGRF